MAVDLVMFKALTANLLIPQMSEKNCEILGKLLSMTDRQVKYNVSKHVDAANCQFVTDIFPNSVSRKCTK